MTERTSPDLLVTIIMRLFLVYYTAALQSDLTLLPVMCKKYNSSKTSRARIITDARKFEHNSITQSLGVARSKKSSFISAMLSLHLSV